MTCSTQSARASPYPRSCGAKVLKDATLNNMVNNVFLINFNTVTSVAITSGIYDSVARKIYV